MKEASGDIIPAAVGGRSRTNALLFNPIRRRRLDEPIHFDTVHRKKREKKKIDELSHDAFSRILKMATRFFFLNSI